MPMLDYGGTDHLPPELQGPAYDDLVAELESTRDAQGIPHGGARVVVVAAKPDA